MDICESLPPGQRPIVALPLMYLARVRLHADRREDALAHWEKAAVSPSQDREALHQIGQAYHKAGRLEDGRSLLERSEGVRARNVLLIRELDRCLREGKSADSFARVAELCEAVGGPCHYMGKAMKDAHAGMGIKNEHFKAILEDLTAAMEKNKVSKDDQVHLVKILAPFRTEIINAPAKPKPTMGAGGFR